MQPRYATLLLFLILSFSRTPPAIGSGFLVIQQGGKSMALAGAITAIADDPTAMFNNPAGITQLEGRHLSIGNTFIRNDQKYETDSVLSPGFEYHEEMHKKTYFLPHVYMTDQLNEKLTLGLAFSTPFGVGTDWSDSSVGNSVANEAQLETYDFNFNVAYKASSKLSLAAGFHYLRLKTQIIHQVGGEAFNSLLSLFMVPVQYTPVSSFETLGPSQLGRLKLDARGDGFGYNLGVLYDINTFWKLGLSFRSHIKIKSSGSENTVEWTPSANNLVPLAFNPILPTRANGSTTLRLPGIFCAGISTTTIPDWTLALDLQYTTWNHFDDLEVKLKPGLAFQTPPVPGVSENNLIVLEEDWGNTWSFHSGAEYAYTDNFAVRAGYFYDKSPIPDRTLGAIIPGSDRHNFSLGCGVARGDWTLDLAYLWSNFENRRTRTNYENFNASYRSNFHLLGVTVTKAL